jgi:hypothetical protein
MISMGETSRNTKQSDEESKIKSNCMLLATRHSAYYNMQQFTQNVVSTPTYMIVGGGNDDRVEVLLVLRGGNLVGHGQQNLEERGKDAMTVITLPVLLLLLCGTAPKGESGLGR